VTETIRCRGCGFLLYFGEAISRRLYMRAIPSEDAVLDLYGRACPKCAAKLSLDSVSIETKGRVRDVA